MTNKTILVTGGAGFIGSHLCSKLIENNCFVYCVDNLSTGSKKNINHLLSLKILNLLNMILLAVLIMIKKLMKFII